MVALLRFRRQDGCTDRVVDIEVERGLSLFVVMSVASEPAGGRKGSRKARSHSPRSFQEHYGAMGMLCVMAR
jgi:hypothetical protein